MYHNKPKSPSPKPHDLGTVSKYDLKNVTSMGLTYEILACGEENIAESKFDRILIVKEGFAHVGDTKFVLRDGDVYEIPAGTSLKIHGQLKYYIVDSKN